MTRKTNTQLQRDRTARIREARAQGIFYFPYIRFAHTKHRNTRYEVHGEYGSSGYMECRKIGSNRLIVIHKKSLEFET